MKKVVAVLISVLLFSTVLINAAASDPAPAIHTADGALERAKEYAHAVNYDFKTPEKIYDFLWSGFQEMMTEEEFIEAFNKERSYPYITPLYIFFPEITKETENGSYIISFLRAARIEGMTYDVEMVYEDGNWFVKDWEQFLDGSYLKKFENIPYSLDWYYDFSETE
ncbi:MAG: hypothetical protein IKP86_00815 [Anaerolineaceae bacterium]|nr:hypothetical protein [Anaerolineaceae bacterium]